MFTDTKRTIAAAALACLGCWLALCGPARAAPTWLAPTDLSPPGAALTAESVATDPAGQVTAVWEQMTGSGYVVVAAEHPDSGGWQAPVDISVPAPGGGVPQLAVDALGDAIVVWAQPDDLGYTVKAAVRPAGGAWETPVDLSADSLSSNLSVPQPRVAVNAQGDAAVIWDFYDGDNATVETAVRSADGTWQPPVDLAAVGYGKAPQVAIDPQGNATAIWPASDGTNEILQAATRPAGGTWSTPVQLSANAFEPQVAADSQGNVTAVWDRYDGAVPTVQAAVRPAGGTWQTPTDVSPTYAVDPQIAVDAQGDVTAVWDHYAGINETNALHTVQAATRPAGGAWQTPADLSATGTLLTVPKVAVNARGDAIAAWDLAGEANTYYHTAQSAVRPAGEAWQAPIALAAAGVGYETPFVALDDQGNATALWQHSLGESSALQAAGYDAAGPLLRGLSIPVWGTAGVPVSFAVSPVDAWSPVATTNWSFGDGQTATDEIVSHTYAKPGTYTVGVSSSDTLGNTTSTTATITIGSAASTPTPAGNTTPAGTTTPGHATLTLTHVTQTHRRWREDTTKATGTRKQQNLSPVGTSFAFAVNETAEVTLGFTQTAAGRRVSGKCRPATRHNRKDTRCRRTVTRGTLTETATAGRHRLAFQGRLTTGRLPLGAYTLTVTATNAIGQRSRPHALHFTIVR